MMRFTGVPRRVLCAQQLYSIITRSEAAVRGECRYTETMSFTQFVSTFWQDITGWLLLLEVVITLATLSAV
ncbi:MAG: hypothetical protein L0241_06310, partial [Planctomycetia bacterium]|nr:hypothetical protein [Planctomycetia bacterium]